ncbi:MAG TPA: hypothetical protein VIL07_11255 [Symbiobacteriaceae bacterium]
MKRLAFLFIPAALLIGCASTNLPPSEAPPQETPNVNEPAGTPDTSTLTPTEQLQVGAQEAVRALRDKDMDRLAALVHPQKGVRFSPYGHVRAEQDGDRVFTAEQVKTLLQDQTVYLWGYYDGSGEPIEMTFADYYEKFVYDQDFANAPKVAVDHIIGQGNTLINLAEVYPDARFVEYHFPGTSQYSGMDWKSLRLVFEQVDGKWYLVGIVHDQWTI